MSIINQFNNIRNSDKKVTESIDLLTQALKELKELEEDMKKNVCINGKIPNSSLVTKSIERIENILKILNLDISPSLANNLEDSMSNGIIMKTI